MIDELEQLTQKIAKQTQHLASLKYRARKADTREKIMLGGLVKKANCHTLPKAVLLGALLVIRDEIDTDASAKSSYEKKGQHAFMGFES